MAVIVGLHSKCRSVSLVRPIHFQNWSVFRVWVREIFVHVTPRVTQCGIAVVIIALRLTVWIRQNSSGTSGLPSSWLEMDRRQRHQCQQALGLYTFKSGLSGQPRLHWIPTPRVANGQNSLVWLSLVLCFPILLLFGTTLHTRLRSENDHAVINSLAAGSLRCSNRLPVTLIVLYLQA